MSKVTKDLYCVLACSYALYLKTHNYHWNIEGPHFKPNHEMLEDQYEDLAEAVDEIAERIRMLGEKVPASFEHFSKSAKIKAGDENKSSKEMIKELVADNKQLSKECLDAIKTCQDAGDEGSADMLVARARAHDKAAWFLEMHTK